MASGSSLGVGVVALAALAVGAGAGAHAFDATNSLERALEEALDSAVRDVTVDWLDVVDAHGHVENDSVRSVEMLVRLDGPVEALALDPIVVETNRSSTNLTVQEILRDEDGSIEEGRLTSGDLLRVRIPLDQGLEAGGSTTLSLHHPEARPLDVDVEAPGALDGDLVRLEVSTAW